MCEFCEKADFSSYSARVDKYGASIYLAVGSGRFEKDEQFKFCPECGEGLHGCKRNIIENMTIDKLDRLIGERARIEVLKREGELLESGARQMYIK